VQHGAAAAPSHAGAALGREARQEVPQDRAGRPRPDPRQDMDPEMYGGSYSILHDSVSNLARTREALNKFCGPGNVWGLAPIALPAFVVLPYHAPQHTRIVGTMWTRKCMGAPTVFAPVVRSGVKFGSHPRES
jgi:hypothetical protein